MHGKRGDNLDQLGVEAEEAIRNAQTVEALGALRVRYLGRRGILAQRFAELITLPAAERPEVGQRLNALRARVEATLAARADELERITRPDGAGAVAIDVTLPGRRTHVGRVRRSPGWK